MPRPAKPRSIIAQVEGSGTEVVSRTPDAEVKVTSLGKPNDTWAVFMKSAVAPPLTVVLRVMPRPSVSPFVTQS
jgi:hypothetical protein